MPDIELLEVLASVLDVPLVQLFYEGQEPLVLPNLPMRLSADEIVRRSMDHKIIE